MEWKRSETIALAKNSCSHCHGLGMRSGRRGKEVPCNCVLRAIFRACYRKFRDCVTREKYLSTVTMEAFGGGADNKYVFSRKTEDYIADFYLVSRRALDGLENRVFKYHFLLGADWKLCCRQMKIDRGTFFHTVYRIEQRLGRTFRELEPYSLYPLDEYFGGTVRKESTRAARVVEMPLRTGPRALVPPVAPAAFGKTA